MACGRVIGGMYALLDIGGEFQDVSFERTCRGLAKMEERARKPFLVFFRRDLSLERDDWCESETLCKRIVVNIALDHLSNRY